MATKQVKVGDVGSVGYQLKAGGAAHNVASSDLLIYASAKDANDGTVLYHERNITNQAKGSGSTASEGKILLPLWSGYSLPGSASNTVDVTNLAANGVVTVTAAACADANCVSQAIYASFNAGAYYMVSSGANNFAAAGVTINTSNSNLVEAIPTVDESATQGQDAITTPPTPTAVLGAGAGLCSNGNWTFKVVNITNADSYTARTMAVEIIVDDRTVSNSVTTWPASDYEYVQFTSDV